MGHQGQNGGAQERQRQTSAGRRFESTDEGLEQDMKQELLVAEIGSEQPATDRFQGTLVAAFEILLGYRQVVVRVAVIEDR
ncbi:MAG: hypothetical protein P8Y44_12270 [Acidobacteriota bacterium]